MSDILSEMQEDFKAMKRDAPDDVVAMARRIVDLQIKYDAARDEKSRLERDLEKAKFALADRIETLGLDGVITPEGFKPKLYKMTKWYIPSSNKDACLAWLEEHGLSDIVKQQVSWKAMQSAMQELEQRGEGPPDGLFTRVDHSSIRMDGKTKAIKAIKESQNE